MTYCGSDIRLMEIDRLRNPYWNILNDSNNVDNLKNDKIDTFYKKFKVIRVSGVTFLAQSDDADQEEMQFISSSLKGINRGKLTNYMVGEKPE